MGKSLNMNYVNCALLVVVLVLVVVCCVKSKTKEGFKYIQQTWYGKRYPKREYCGRRKVCGRLRTKQDNFLKKQATDCNRERVCATEKEFNKKHTGYSPLTMYKLGVSKAEGTRGKGYTDPCTCPQGDIPKDATYWGDPRAMTDDGKPIIASSRIRNDLIWNGVKYVPRTPR